MPYAIASDFQNSSPQYMDIPTPLNGLTGKVLQMIESDPSDVQDLLKKLRQEGISEDAARAVMSELIDRNAIIFTKDWRVEVNPLASAAA
jgi:microsomal dipeptidase-like Zn-dependent dipeptidase